MHPIYSNTCCLRSVHVFGLGSSQAFPVGPDIFKARSYCQSPEALSKTAESTCSASIVRDQLLRNTGLDPKTV